MQKFIQSKIDLEIRDASNKTALIWACAKNNVEISRLLIDRKVRLNILDNNKKYPLNYTFENRNFQLMAYLIENSAIPNVIENVLIHFYKNYSDKVFFLNYYQIEI